MSKAAKIALIMAGGTGGHIFPAQAVATLLAAEGWTIHWFRDRRSDGSTVSAWFWLAVPCHCGGRFAW